MSTENQKCRTVVKAYAAAVVIFALITLGSHWTQRPEAWSGPLRAIADPARTVLYWSLLTIAAEAFWFVPRTGFGMVSMSLAVNLASVLVLPATYALPIAAGSVLFADLVFHRRCPLRATFNAAQTTISLAAVAWMLHRSSPGSAPIDSFLFDPFPILLGFLVFFVLNTGIVSGVLALENRQGLFSMWQRCFVTTQFGMSTLAHYIMAVALARAYFDVGFVSGLSSVLFFALIREAMQNRSANVVPASS